GNRAGSRPLDAHRSDIGDAVRTAPVFFRPGYVLSEPLFPGQDGAVARGPRVSIYSPSQGSQFRSGAGEGAPGGVYFPGAVGKHSGRRDLHRICLVSILDAALWVQSTWFFTELRLSAYVYPVVLTLHVTGMALFGGMILVS